MNRKLSKNKRDSPKSRPQSPAKQGTQFHKKQIEETLNELHKLQSEIYELNVPENPHSSGPIKKEIKQLSFLYENMTKPKTKNNLNVQLKDIESALKIMNEGIGAVELEKKKKVKGHPIPTEESADGKSKVGRLSKSGGKEIKLILSKSPEKEQESDWQKVEKKSANQTKIASSSLKMMMKETFCSSQQFDLSLLSATKSSNPNYISSEEIYNFINFNEHDQFSPLEEAYNILLDEDGNFDFKQYNKINEILGLPKIKDEGILKVAIGLNEKDEMNFETFRKVLESEIGHK